jgi:hypothetical protein
MLPDVILVLQLGDALLTALERGNQRWCERCPAGRPHLGGSHSWERVWIQCISLCLCARARVRV